MTNAIRVAQIMCRFLVCSIVVPVATQVDAQQAVANAIPPGYVHRFSAPVAVDLLGKPVPNSATTPNLLGSHARGMDDETPHYATPQQNNTPNSYVSGTDLEWGFHVTWPDTVDPNGLDSMELDVSGTDLNGNAIQNQVVASVDFTSCAIPHPQHWTVGARIDTTNFQTGSVLTIHASNKPHDPQWVGVPSTWTVAVNNSLYEAGNLSLDIHAPAMYEDAMGSMADSLMQPYVTPDSNVNMDGLPVDPTLDLLPPYTAFITVTHGDIAAFGDGEEDPQDDPDGEDMIPATLVADTVGQKTAEQPPYTFAYFDACLVFGDVINAEQSEDNDPVDDSMAAAFLEGDTAAALPSASSSDDDRAALGYQYVVYENVNKARFDEALINDMAYSNASLQDAVYYAYGQSAPWGETAGTINNPTGVGKVMPLIEGDESMTLRGVYQGQLEPPAQLNPSCAKGLQANGVWYAQDLDEVYTGP
jgi:hypothetical protein